MHWDWMQCVDYHIFIRHLRIMPLSVGSQGWHMKPLLVARREQLEHCNGFECRSSSSGTEHLLSSGISCSSSGESNLTLDIQTQKITLALAGLIKVKTSIRHLLISYFTHMREGAIVGGKQVPLQLGIDNEIFCDRWLLNIRLELGHVSGLLPN